MKHLCLAAFVTVLATLCAAGANADDSSTSSVPDAVLTDLGLDGIESLSEQEGMEVRGKTAIHVGHSRVEVLFPTLIAPNSNAGPVTLPTSAADGIATALASPPASRFPR